MKKSLFDNPRAFAIFYDTMVAVEGTRQGRVLKTGGLMACVIDLGLDDAVAEGDTASTRQRFSVAVRQADWPDTLQPQVGDNIIFADGNGRLSGLSVARSLGDIVMEARSC